MAKLANKKGTVSQTKGTVSHKKEPVSHAKGAMPPMWSVRMRASRARGTRQIHISGAEGLYGAGEISRAVERYRLRALNHPRGVPDSIVITIEKLRQRPRAIEALPLCTLECGSPQQAKTLAKKLLLSTGVSETALKNAFNVIRNKKPMSGAALISVTDGKRLEPDRMKGIRASRMGMEKSTIKALGIRLSRLGINTDTVKEALVLASKVASHRGVVAELCISDDPGYTTGYVASKKYGYVRIPNIKGATAPGGKGGNGHSDKGSGRGGRIFFIKPGADIKGLVDYLRQRPVMVSRLSETRGSRSLSELIHNPYS